MLQTTVSRTWQLDGVHHLGLTVADIERSIVFYRDTLGMTLHRRRPHVDNEYVAQQTGYDGVVLNVASFRVADSSQTLEVVQYMTHGAPRASAATNQPGISHLCLTVNDLQSAYEDLRSRGVRFRSTPVRITAGPNTGGLVVYFEDPDGYTLELFQPPLGT
jgi:catechol 2,3-dioxygenase-like lactoylglutathione lyase family enzyme